MTADLNDRVVRRDTSRRAVEDPGLVLREPAVDLLDAAPDVGERRNGDFLWRSDSRRLGDPSGGGRETLAMRPQPRVERLQ
jgi:hypothetical protein